MHIYIGLRHIVRDMSIKQCRNPPRGMLSSTIRRFLFFRLRLDDYATPLWQYITCLMTLRI